MKTNRKKLTNKEITERTNILIMELQKHGHAIDTLFMTLSHYIEMNGDSDKIRDFILKKNKETEGVQSEHKKPSS